MKFRYEKTAFCALQKAVKLPYPLFDATILPRFDFLVIGDACPKYDI